MLENTFSWSKAIRIIITIYKCVSYFRLDLLLHPDPFKCRYLDHCDYACVLVHAHAPFLAVVFLGNAGQNAEKTIPKRCRAARTLLAKT
jgi:hypothetical protein